MRRLAALLLALPLGAAAITTTEIIDNAPVDVAPKLPGPLQEKCAANGGCVVVSKDFLRTLVQAAKAEQMKSIVEDLPPMHDEFGHCRIGGA
jgi:hypothetical protein